MAKQNLQELPDDQLFALVKAGNQLAFKQIYHKYWEGLYIYAHNILNDKWLSEDVLHEVFTNVWTNREKTEIHNLKSYLFNAVRNRALLKIRAHKFTELDEKIVSNLKLPPQIEQQFDHNDLKHTIDVAAKELPPRCRAIFYMSKFHNYSTAEIANHFNISQRTVENQISLALRHLRGQLGNVPCILVFLSSL
ncbi:MAG: RNA polymerase sigma-70 factor [Bacteroidota bacterium]